MLREVLVEQIRDRLQDLPAAVHLCNGEILGPAHAFEPYRLAQHLILAGKPSLDGAWDAPFNRRHVHHCEG
ncbi:MAG: hypothetical protein MUC79_02100 [Thiobacillaceae bacterium]|nr:hypothetical protein [Thiobacillaceae bacterium]